MAHQQDVLQVPVQAVFEHGGRHYAVVQTPEGWEARTVEIGLTNEKYVVIREGLAEGEMVAMNAAAFREEIDLPELPAGPPEARPEGPMLAESRREPPEQARPRPGALSAGAGGVGGAEPPGSPPGSEAKGAAGSPGVEAAAVPARAKPASRKSKPRVQAAAAPQAAPS